MSYNIVVFLASSYPELRLINYNKLPFRLCPFNFKGYEKGKKETIYWFCFTYNDLGEFVGYGYGIPVNSERPKFVIENIVCYYYNANDILIRCIDTKERKHWIKPFQIKGQVQYFYEVTCIKKSDLNKYKYVKILD